MPQQTTSPGKFRILIVEDDEAMRDLLKTIVANQGYEPIEAAKVKDAIYHVERGNAHLMLLDLQMPGASGFDLLRSMRRKRLQVPTVVVSGYISQTAAKQLAELGVQGMIAKPFSSDRIQAEIQKALSLWQAG